MHIDDCPVEDLIPVYLIVSGSAPMLMGGLARLKKKDEDDTEITNLKERINIFTIIGFLGFLFTFAWLICGKHIHVSWRFRFF